MIITVGDLVTDVLAVLRAPLAPGSDTPATVHVAGGGQAANTAAWIAWLGQPVIFVGAVGDDQAGRDRLAELHAAGVRTQVSVRPGASTGSIVVLTHSGERTMISDRGANLLLTPSDVDSAIALGGTHLHLSGYTLLDQASRPAGRAALASAKAAGLRTSVDAASAAPLATLTARHRAAVTPPPTAASPSAASPNPHQPPKGAPPDPSAPHGHTATPPPPGAPPGLGAPHGHATTPPIGAPPDSGVPHRQGHLGALRGGGAQSTPSVAASHLGRHGGEVPAEDEPWRRSGPDTGPVEPDADFLEWVQGVDLLIANADEARALAGPGGDPGEHATKLARAIGGNAVVKLGPQGALWAGPEGLLHVPIEPAHIVDATGAGDAFAAGLIAALNAGADIATALHEGCRLGAQAVTQVGARPPVR